MAAVVEKIRGLFPKSPVSEQQEIPLESGAILLPTDEERIKLEAECQQILRCQVLSKADFHSFTAGMIRLLGGWKSYVRYVSRGKSTGEHETHELSSSLPEGGQDEPCYSFVRIYGNRPKTRDSATVVIAPARFFAEGFYYGDRKPVLVERISWSDITNAPEPKVLQQIAIPNKFRAPVLQSFITGEEINLLHRMNTISAYTINPARLTQVCQKAFSTYEQLRVLPQTS